MVVEGTEHRIRHAIPVPASGNEDALGEVLDKHGDGWTVRTGDGVVRLFSV